MKHKYLLSGILLAGLMLLSGCENNFDAKIYGELSTTNFPQTASDYESYMMDCYIPFTSYWGLLMGRQPTTSVLHSYRRYYPFA